MKFQTVNTLLYRYNPQAETEKLNLRISRHKCYLCYKQKQFGWSLAKMSGFAVCKAISGNKYWTVGIVLPFCVYSLISHTKGHLVACLGP